MKQLQIDKYLDATSSSVIIAAADNFARNGIFTPAIQTQGQIAGVGMIPINEREIIIYNSSVKDNSLIYITPNSSVAGSQLTVTKKMPGYFVVTTDNINHLQLSFDWLIVN